MEFVKLDEKDSEIHTEAFSRTLGWVAGLNLAYFGVEIFYALQAGSVSLFADSIDFMEDASVNFLILLALWFRWPKKARARLGGVLAGVLLIPSLGALWTAVQKFLHPTVPEASALTWVAVGALLINSFCAFRLARFRTHHGSLTKAAFLSARNDVAANLAMIVAGVLTAKTQSFWPDLLVGIGICVVNADAAREIWEEARQERLAAHS